MISVFKKFVDMHLLVQNMVFLGICLWTLEKNVYSVVIVRSIL